MRKYILYILILVVLQGAAPSVQAQNNTPPATNTQYQLLAPLPCSKDTPGCAGGKLEIFDASTDKSGSALSSYLNLIVQLVIGISAILAVVMIVMGGIEYMGSELISSKEAGKDRIKDALLGLLIALGAYALLNTINPSLLKSDINIPDAKVTITIDDQIKGRTGGGSCVPINTGVCSPQSLQSAGFANGVQASSICNGESRGNPTMASGVDKCKDGNSFSFGLFQINTIAHANTIPGGVCSGVFQTNGSGTQGTCLERKNGVCMKYDCPVTNSAKYQSCINYITNVNNNLNYAKNLQAKSGWGQWGFNSSCGF